MLELLLTKRPVSRPPFWMMRQAGRYLPEYRAMRQQAGSFMGLALTPESAAEVTVQPVHRFGLSAAILFSDILMVPYGLGQSLEFVEGEGPVLGPLESVEHQGLTSDFDRRLEPVMEAIRHILHQKPPVPLIGFAGGPWTVLCYMIRGRGGDASFFEAKAFAYQTPARFQALLDLVRQATEHYLRAQIQAGCQILQIFESAAGILSPEEFQNWVLAVQRPVVQSLKKDYPHVPILGFPRGVGASVIEYAQTVGVDGVGIDAMVSAPLLRHHLPDTVIQGGLHPDLLRVGGEPLTREIQRLLESYRGHPYILNLSHGVHPQTPLEHVMQAVEQWRAWRA